MIHIRPENNADIPRIYQVTELAFRQNNESELINKVRSSEAFIPGLSLVAVLNEQIIGHILFSKIHIQTAKGPKEVLSLAPMAVIPDHQQKGVGGQLIRAGLEEAAKSGFAGVLVLGHPGYYPRFGFQPAADFGIECPFPAPAEAWMALELIPGGLKNKAGMAVFPEVFNDT